MIIWYIPRKFQSIGSAQGRRLGLWLRGFDRNFRSGAERSLQLSDLGRFGELQRWCGPGLNCLHTLFRRSWPLDFPVRHVLNMWMDFQQPKILLQMPWSKELPSLRRTASSWSQAFESQLFRCGWDWLTGRTGYSFGCVLAHQMGCQLQKDPDDDECSSVPFLSRCQEQWQWRI